MRHTTMNWLRRLLGAAPLEPGPGTTAPTEQSASSDTPVTAVTEECIGTVVPYDENLLKRARTQWQLGDWQSLTAIGRNSLEHHPDRAKLALLVASGHAQVGDIATARQFFRLAEDWGCSKRLIGQILIAGVHNSLGHAAAVAGQPQRVQFHLEQSVCIGMPNVDSRLLIQARSQQQLSNLELFSQNTLSSIDQEQSDSQHFFTQAIQKPNIFKAEIIAQHDLGMAWAGNTINMVIFRHHGIFTHKGLQTTAFYFDKHTIRLVQRNLYTEEIQTYDLIGEYNLRDAHNSISLGVDRQGYLHISYDHHATRLRYRRSTKPNDITHWTDELPMTGQAEDKVTYPTFILPRHGYPLTLLYRDGIHNKGTARLKTYDEVSQSWADHPIPVLSGAEQRPWTSNAYWNHPAIGNDGSLHLSFVWRTHTLGEEGRLNNINICYARSRDNGLTWETTQGRPYQLPITQVNAEVIYPVSPGSNLINQCSMALDSSNKPHIAFYSDDANGIPQYQHLWFDGKRWRHQEVSKRTAQFSLAGQGTLQIPISRPEVILDNNDNAYFIYRGDLSENRIVISKLAAPDYQWNVENDIKIWSEDIAFSEPIIDRSRWNQDQLLTLLVQRNYQPNHDDNHADLFQPVTLLDANLNKS